MASLNKLAIRGIRSFDDKQISIIEFFSPVTVIVGHNGSGKTTIIECLKYATTGDQPANTRGGAFVHDPKMANEKEVKAQVKLRFHAANGNRMLAVRNLSVTVKKTGLTMKTLESILALADASAESGGKRGVISTKCAEMDVEIPQLLGVSKAVLENVIFCHQEDSYWPLAEPSALKKKFDDIFEATRYTKALDSIKALRKDRVAELKAEKERLLSLSIQKGHADKLKDRIADLSATIATKEVEYENTKQESDAIVESNRRFYDLYTKFREIYLKVEHLENTNEMTNATLADMKLKYQEVEGTNEELATREAHFEDHINAQKQQQRIHEREKDDTESEIQGLQLQQRDTIEFHGRLKAEAEEQKRRISEREQAIHEISDTYGIRGFGHSPLEREKVVEFLSRLGDVQRKQKLDFENLQREMQSSRGEYQQKRQEFENALESLKLRRQRLRDDISERQTKSIKAERTLEELQTLSSSLRILKSNMEEKRSWLEKAKAELTSAQFDSRLSEKAEKGRRFEEKREELSHELQNLSTQAESRASLALKRTEIKNKTLEFETYFETVASKLKAFGRNVTLTSVEKEITQLHSQKEHEETEITREAATANGNLQKAEADLAHLKAQLRLKKNELKELGHKITKALEEGGQTTLQVAIEDANEQLSIHKSEMGDMVGKSTVYQSFLKNGRTKKICSACTRRMTDREFVVFEEQILNFMKECESNKIKDKNVDVDEWEQEVVRLQKFIPVQTLHDTLKVKEIPELESKLKQQEQAHPNITEEAEKAEERLQLVRRQLKELATLRQQVISITALQSEVAKASQDVEHLERTLTATGSTRTADDVRDELNELSVEIRRNERERNSIISERDHQSSTCQNLQNSLHELELEEGRFALKIHDKEGIEANLEKMRQEISAFTNQIRDLDSKIVEAQAPIENLQREFQRLEKDLQLKVNQAEHAYRILNQNSDRLNDMNKGVERYVKDRKARALEDCSSRLEQCDLNLQELNGRLEEIRKIISGLEKEANQSGATLSNLRDNIMARNLMKQIADAEKEIGSYDMEEAAKARRNYETKYEPAKQKERALQEAYLHLSGELSTLKVQLKTLETDLKGFKDVYKKYTDQLIRVKVSDMANSDLEKYAKALDNAIMKYHGLKMEEVNDTMKHLWNKTYQGTDIDGIKIRSDAEGGATKRSYNYRVVMTKDQVEMDMRGRCSAGQKMLASIIIRLALSDSFGQNCGILALDEPTNALDTENIDALAASLVDIINERKGHSNFQLIVITHDENFLRKLGQSDVMEYYWRVSRDSRQKSVITRQRFG